MILLKTILLEGKREDAALEYLKYLVKNGPFKNRVFLVGGAVRDMEMGLSPKDLDIVITGNIDSGMNFAIWATRQMGNYKDGANPVLFKTFGTAKFTLNGVKYHGIDLSNMDIESVATRKEKYTIGNRKPEVSAGELKDDVFRRDFTVNSLMLDLTTGETLDLTGEGQSDIKKGIIRTTSDPNVIFKEDPLRMLRACRFSIRYNWKIDPKTYKALKRNAKMLKNISAERIQEELNKILMSDHPEVGVRYLIDTDLMKYIIPEYYGLVGMSQNFYHEFDAFEHSMRVLQNSPKRLEVRLGALFHDLGKIKTKITKDDKVHFYGHEFESAKMTEEAMKRLKYSTDIIKRVTEIVKHHMRTKSYGHDAELAKDKTLRKLMHALGDNLEDLLDLVHADNTAHGAPGWEHNMERQVDAIRVRLQQLGDFTGKLKMPIDGNKVMKMLDIEPGKDVGIIMNKIKDKFLEDPDKINSMSDEEIEKTIRRMYNRIPK